MAWNLPPGHRSAKGDLYGKRMSRVQQHREDGRAYSDEGRKVRSAWLARAILAAVVVLLVVGQECRGEHIVEPRERLDAAPRAGSNEAAKHGRRFAAAVATEEGPVPAVMCT